MKAVKILAVVLVLTIISSVAYSKYTPDEWERMKKGEILITQVAAKNKDGSQRMDFMAKLYIKAPRKEVWRNLRDYNHFHEFMPKLKKATITKKEGAKYWVKYETKILGMKVDYYLIVDGVEPLKRIEYKLDTSKKNDIRDTYGYWIFEDAPGGKGTVLSYSSFVDTGIPAPEALIKKVAKSAMPGIVKNVRMRAESRGKWKKPEGS